MSDVELNGCRRATLACICIMATGLSVHRDRSRSLVGDFKIRYGEVLLRLRKVKFTSGDVSTCVAVCFSTTAKYFVWRSPQYVSINFHFHAIFMIISLFSEVKFKD